MPDSASVFHSERDYLSGRASVEKCTGPGLLTRKCRRNVLLGTGVIALVAGLFVWRQSQSDALLTRIHHGLVVCAAGTAAMEPDVLPAPLPDQPVHAAEAEMGRAATAVKDALSGHKSHPMMVQLDVKEAEDGQLRVQQGDLLLKDALKVSHRNRELVMLSLHDTEPADVVKVIRATGMRHRVILAAEDTEGTRDALKADRSIVVAIPVTSKREEYAARRMAGKHPFAAWVPADSSSALFAQAHHDASAVITDTSHTLSDPSQVQALLNEPVDIVVTDNPDRLSRFIQSK